MLTAAAWSAPVIAAAVAAPMASASPCTISRNGTVAFTTTGRNYNRNANTTSGVATVTLQGAVTGDTPVRVDFVSSFANLTTGTTAQRVTYAPLAGNLQPTDNGLDLFHSKTGTNSSSLYGQKVTISFDRTVRNLRFRLAEFSTSSTNNNVFVDGAWVNLPPTSVTGTTTVSGLGTQQSPWIAPANSTSGQMLYKELTYATIPFGTSLVVHFYSSNATATNQQGLYIQNMSFSSFGRVNCG